jgi:hypothetical protein
LFPVLLGSRWNALSLRVRAMHGSERRVRARGTAEVRGDDGAAARALRRLLRMPTPAAAVPLEVEIERDGVHEAWCRTFARERFASKLAPSTRWADAFEERIGPVRLTFAVEIAAGRMRWVTREVRAFGVRLPLRVFSGVQASCGERKGRYDFDIRVTLPGVGLLIAYAGMLEIVDVER